MFRIIPFLIVLALGYALLGGCNDKPSRSGAGYSQVQQLAAENQELRKQNADLREVHGQAFAELKAARRSADRADIAVRTSYLGYGPLGAVLMLLGSALAALSFVIIRRRRRGSAP